jgi:histidine triad (HIT) family protein
MDNCLFCKIASHAINSDIVYENEEIICFRDIHPAAPVHVLIVPKKHFTDILALAKTDESGDVMHAVLTAIPRVASICGVLEDGFRVINNCGVNGGQSIPHLHFHLIGGRKLGEKIL